MSRSSYTLTLGGDVCDGALEAIADELDRDLDDLRCEANAATLDKRAFCLEGNDLSLGCAHDLHGRLTELHIKHALTITNDACDYGSAFVADGNTAGNRAYVEDEGVVITLEELRRARQAGDVGELIAELERFEWRPPAAVYRAASTR